MKQTAVEWLEQCLLIHFTKEQKSQFLGLFIQAKEMEKQQIVNADLNATKRTAKGVNADVSIRRVKELAEQYYNKTYGGNK